MSSSYGVPSFGAPVNVYSPKSGYASPQTYQPLPIVASPSFGTPYGGSQTPPQHNRHTSYNKSAEPEPTSIPPSVERVRRHREYYLDGGDIIFLVENILFRVHRYFFERESPVFRKQLADAAHGGHHRIGMSDADPCVLHDVRTEDFSRFLWVFYNPIYSIYDATTEDWAAILGLAHHWQFSEIKALVVRELEKQVIPSITKIVIYHRYAVERNLLLPSYVDLCLREQTLDYEEAKDLGLETSMMIMQTREIIRKSDGSKSATVIVSNDELRHVIRQVFRFPGPRSDTPVSIASDATAAEGNSPPKEEPSYPDPNAHLPSEEQDKPSDLHIKTQTTPTASPAPPSSGTGLTAESLAALASESTKPSSTFDDKKKSQDKKSSLPLPPSAVGKDGDKDATTSATKEAVEPVTPVQGSQFDDNRPMTPTAGQSATATDRTRKIADKAKKAAKKREAARLSVVTPPEVEPPTPTLPTKATEAAELAGSVKLSETRDVGVAGDAVREEVVVAKVDDTKVVKDEKKVNMMDNDIGPGDNTKIDTQQQRSKHEKQQQGSDDGPKSAATTKDMTDNIGSLLGNDLGADKGAEAKLPWPTLDADKSRATSKNPFMTASTKPNTKKTKEEEKREPEPVTFLVPELIAVPEARAVTPLVSDTVSVATLEPVAVLEQVPATTLLAEEKTPTSTTALKLPIVPVALPATTPDATSIGVLETLADSVALPEVPRSGEVTTATTTQQDISTVVDTAVEVVPPPADTSVSDEPPAVTAIPVDVITSTNNAPEPVLTPQEILAVTPDLKVETTLPLSGFLDSFSTPKEPPAGAALVEVTTVSTCAPKPVPVLGELPELLPSTANVPPPAADPEPTPAPVASTVSTSLVDMSTASAIVPESSAPSVEPTEATSATEEMDPVLKGTSTAEPLIINTNLVAVDANDSFKADDKTAVPVTPASAVVVDSDNVTTPTKESVYSASVYSTPVKDPVPIPPVVAVKEEVLESLPDLKKRYIKEFNQKQKLGESLLARRKRVDKEASRARGENDEDWRRRLTDALRPAGSPVVNPLETTLPPTPLAMKGGQWGASSPSSPKVNAKKGVNPLQFSMSSDVPLSDDDFFDCNSSAASVSNFDG